MVVSSVLAHYVLQFSARLRPYRGQCVFREVDLFTVPLSDAPAFRAFLELVAGEASQAVADEIQSRSARLRRGGWVFAVYDGRGFRVLGVSSIASSISFFRCFYAQFVNLDVCGFYDSYRPAPLLIG